MRPRITEASLRAREVRLGRFFRRAALLLLAVPAPGVVASCTAGAGVKATSQGTSSGGAPVDDGGGGSDGDAGSAPFDAGAGGAGGSGGGGPEAGAGGNGDVDASDAGDAAPADTGVPVDECAPIRIDASYLDPEAGTCLTYELLPCGISSADVMPGCLPTLAECVTACGDQLIYGCFLVPTSCSYQSGVIDGAATIIACDTCLKCTGRRPRGLCAAPVSGGGSVGAYFASMAHLEAASVRAFRDLASSLRAFGAPVCLVGAAASAAGDERRHARAASRLARRFGGATPRVTVRRVRAPSLVELLEDDVVEGCVGETFGALVATWQAAHAGDARVRRTMRRVAEDETRHAALAWEVLRWGAPRLAACERARVWRKMEAALAELEAGGVGEAGEEALRVAGHPSRDVEGGLVREFAAMVRGEAGIAAGSSRR